MSSRFLWNKILNSSRIHPLRSIDTMMTTAADSSDGNDGTYRCRVDYRSTDYRGFCLGVHREHGLLLLHCTRKVDKPPHHQLAGGHVDELEFVMAARKSSDRRTQLYLAARSGVARELYEETGIDARAALDRFGPMVLRGSSSTDDDDDNNKLVNEHENRLFFVLPLTDDDFVTNTPADPTVRIVRPMGDTGKNLMLKLSVEHSGFTFESDPQKATNMLRLHSGGKVAEAIKKAIDMAKE